MGISARNKLVAKVVSVETGQVNVKVKLKLSEGGELTSVITKDALNELSLKEDDEVIAIIKASDVLIGTEKLSVRNILKGKIIEIIEGMVEAEVKIALNKKDVISSVITKESVKELSLEKDKEVFALIKASNVIIGKAF